MTDEITNGADGGEIPRRRAQTLLIGFIVVLAATGAYYRLVHLADLHRSAALYIGVPAVLAIGLVLLPRSRSATGMALKGSVVAMLIATVVLPEGFLCLLMATPLVVFIAVGVGATVDLTTRERGHQRRSVLFVAIPLAIMAAEGAAGSPFETRDRTTASVVVEATPAEVAAALAAPPTFDTTRPAFLSLGFNHPVAAEGAGLEIGDRRVIHFAGGSHEDHPKGLAGSGADGHSTMELTVVRSQPGRVELRVDQDHTMLARWVDLDRSVVTWEPVDATTTRVTWTLVYERLLFPTAYFGPVQRYGMGTAADYLLDAVIVDPLR
jgi:hypothetical protein